MPKNTVWRLTYRAVKEMFGRYTEEEIGTRLDVSRGSVHRNIWIIKFSQVVPEIEKWYLEGKLNDPTLFKLKRAYDEDTLAKEWVSIRGGEEPIKSYVCRPLDEIQKAMERTRDKRVKQTLEWVLSVHKTI